MHGENKAADAAPTTAEPGGPGRRALLVAAGALAVLAVLGVGLSVWLVARQDSPDCAVVAEFLAYTRAQDQRVQQLPPAGRDDPRLLLEVYQHHSKTMHRYVRKVSDTHLRAQLTALAGLDDQMIADWHQGLGHPSPAAADHADRAARYDNVVRGLQQACPVGDA